MTDSSACRIELARSAPLRRGASVSGGLTADGGVLLHSGTGRCYGLNGVAAELWRVLAKTHTCEQLTRLLVARFPETPARHIEEDVRVFLLDLLRWELIELAGEDGV